jgi:hypothetical protein
MVSKDTLIDYLLHRMPERERLDFAEKWFSDTDFREQLETAEAELLDAYVRADLPRKQREGVERYLLNSDGQRRKLKFAAALHAALPARSRPRISWVAVCAAAVILVALLVTGGGLFSVTRKNQDLRTELARLRLARSNHDAQPVAAGVYSMPLISSLRESVSPIPLVLPKDTLMVRLDLELGDGEDRDPYLASLSLSGVAVWKEEPLRKETGAGASLVSFWIPAHLLRPGNYTVALQSAGAPIAYYTLVVSPEAVKPDHRAP